MFPPRNFRKKFWKNNTFFVSINIFQLMKKLNSKWLWMIWPNFIFWEEVFSKNCRKIFLDFADTFSEFKTLLPWMFSLIKILIVQLTNQKTLRRENRQQGYFFVLLLDKTVIKRGVIVAPPSDFYMKQMLFSGGKLLRTPRYLFRSFDKFSAIYWPPCIRRTTVNEVRTFLVSKWEFFLSGTKPDPYVFTISMWK